LWNAQEGKQMKSWTAHGSGALCVSYAHDGRLVSCGRDRTVTIWNANGGKVRNLEFSGDLPLRAVFNWDDKRIFVADFAGAIGVWTAADGKRVGEVNANPATVVVEGGGAATKTKKNPTEKF